MNKNKRRLGVIVIVAKIRGNATSLLLQGAGIYFPHMMYPYYGYGGYGYGMMGYGFLDGLVHAAGVIITILVILWIIRRFVWGRDGRHMHHWRSRWIAGSGLEILNERFAKGEITKEEYQERRKTLLGE